MSCFINEIKRLLDSYEASEDREAIDVLLDELTEYIDDLKEEIRGRKNE